MTYDVARTIDPALKENMIPKEFSMRRFALALCLALAAFAAPALADSAKEAIVIKDVNKFLDYQRDVRADMKTSKFKHVDNSSKTELFRAQDELFALLKGKQSVDQLSEDERLKVYNAQQTIAGVLTDAELDRPICKREKRLGSNRLMTVCETRRQRQDNASNVQNLMRAPKTCAPGEVCG